MKASKYLPTDYDPECAHKKSPKEYQWRLDGDIDVICVRCGRALLPDEIKGPEREGIAHFRETK